MKIPAVIILLFGVSGLVFNQQTVYFYAADGVKIRADLYLNHHQLPFILLFHENGSNRSEYYEIAPRMMNLDYNCLAVDLRGGGSVNFIENETLQNASSNKSSINLLDAGKDILAAINYTRNFNKQQVILFGSAFSASLCMIYANDNPDVKGVVAINPGEYFQPRLSVEREISGFNKQLFLVSTETEYAYIEKMIHEIPETLKTIATIIEGEGIRGTKVLSKSSPDNETYWFELLMFFKKML